MISECVMGVNSILKKTGLNRLPVCADCWDCQKEQLYSASMASCTESQSDDECSELDLSSDLSMIGKMSWMNKGRWTREEVNFGN